MKMWKKNKQPKSIFSFPPFSNCLIEMKLKEKSQFWNKYFPGNTLAFQRLTFLQLYLCPCYLLRSMLFNVLLVESVSVSQILSAEATKTIVGATQSLSHVLDPFILCFQLSMKWALDESSWIAFGKIRSLIENASQLSNGMICLNLL